MARAMGAETRTLGRPAWAKDFGGREHIVPFPAKLNPAEFPDSSAILVKLNGAASAGTDEQQTVTIDATGGTFTLTYSGQTTGAIAYNATAAAVEAALEALSNIPENGVEVTGNAGGPYTVKFRGTLGKQNVAQLTSNAASLTGGASTVTHATTVPGVAPDDSLTVDALSGPVPAGTNLYFGTGVMAHVSADAAAGATTIDVDALTADIADNAEARFSKFGTKFIPSGTLVGRTFAERDANAAFGLGVSSDDELYLTVFDVVDALTEDDCELYRHGGVVAENHLPQTTKDGLAASAPLLAALRSLYVCINAEA
jgi:hypothetical protein